MSGGQPTLTKLDQLLRRTKMEAINTFRVHKLVVVESKFLHDPPNTIYIVVANVTLLGKKSTHFIDDRVYSS